MSDNTLEQYVESMGRDLGSAQYALYEELVWLHAKWTLYKQVFVGSDMDLLNDTAAGFFGIIQRTLLEDVVLHVSRITDSKKSCGRDNLVLAMLPELVEESDLRARVQALVLEARTACEKFRMWRNRSLAHRDLELVRRAESDLLRAVDLDEMETALRACRDVLNTLEYSYQGSQVGYEHVLVSAGDGDMLLAFLRRGLTLENDDGPRVPSVSSDGQNNVEASGHASEGPGAGQPEYVGIDLTRMLHSLPPERLRHLLDYCSETNPLAVRRWRRSLSPEDKELLDAIESKE